MVTRSIRRTASYQKKLTLIKPKYRKPIQNVKHLKHTEDHKNYLNMHQILHVTEVSLHSDYDNCIELKNQQIFRNYDPMELTRTFLMRKIHMFPETKPAQLDITSIQDISSNGSMLKNLREKYMKSFYKIADHRNNLMGHNASLLLSKTNYDNMLADVFDFFDQLQHFLANRKFKKSKFDLFREVIQEVFAEIEELSQEAFQEMFLHFLY